MELRDLRYFCLTAELKHVSRAAETMGISQPFLTKVITQLEKEVGTQLFDNTNRRITLNSYGEVFYDRAKKIVADVDGLLEEMDEMLEKGEKTLNILADTAGYTSDLMLEYNKYFPDKNLSITYEKRGSIIEALTIGTVDFAICTPPITESESKMIETIIVYVENGCIFLPPNHPLQGRESLGLSDLVGQPLVTSPKGAGVRNNLEIVFEREGYVPNIVCESNDMDLLIKAVLGGLGFAFMPKRLFKDPRYTNYCSKTDLAGEYSAKIGLSYNKTNLSSRKHELFRDFIKSFFLDFSEKYG